MVFTELADIMIQYERYVSNVYLRALITLVVFFVLSKIVVYIFEKIFLRLASKTKTKVDDLIVEKTNKPVSFALLLIGIIIAIQQIPLKQTIADTTEKVLISIVILTIGITAVKIITIIINEWGKNWAKKTKSKTDDNIVFLLERASKIAIYIFVLIYVLNYWGIEIGPMIASLGIAGIAIAFALQSTLGNIFGGISMIVDKSVSVGDVVQIDQNTSGKVVDVGLRSTKIQTWDNEIIVIPNGQFSNSQIHNIVLPDPQVRVVVPFSVAYGTDVDKVKKLVLGEIKKIKECLNEPEPIVRFLEMGDSALMYKAFFWVNDFSERYGAKEEANIRIYNALNKAKISIPFPQMDVHIKEHKKK
jgi:MscS family membrane protein